MSTAADIIARRLYAAGCRDAFGIPGGEVLTMMNALEAAGIRFHLVKHENNGGFMAEGTHHATRAPGILLATVGPGVVNAINVVANAWQDQVPLVFLTGRIDADQVETYTHQVFDHNAVLAPITKASFTAAEGAVDVIIDKAVNIALDDAPGPVHINMPIRLAAAEEPGDGTPKRARPAPMAPAGGPELEAARTALGAAERPLMIAGVDVLHHGAADEVADFARRFSMPVITTYKAKGVLPEDDALALGGHGLSPKSFKVLQPLVESADLIVLAGYNPIEMRIDWRDAWKPGASQTVLEFASTANTHYVHQASHTFIGHVGAGLERLGDGINLGAVWSNGAPGAVRNELRAAFPRDEVWGPAAVIDAVRRALPRDGVVGIDTGAHRILASQQWECYAPRTMLQSTALCTMGVALPIAIGHKIAKPDVPVLAFTGDAGLEMVLGELATARDLKLPIVVVVFVDRSLALIELKQRDMGFDNLGVDFKGTDFAAVADAMGGVGVVATDRNSVERAVDEGLGRDTFTVIACPIGEKAYDGRF